MSRNLSSNIRIIYLNNSEIDEEFQKNLLEIHSNVLFYTDYQLFVNFLKTISNENIFLITSLNFLNKISLFQSILIIFIYDINHQEEIHDLKIKYPNIIDQYLNKNDLFISLQKNIQFIEKQTFIYNLFHIEQQLIKDLTKQSAVFLWYQLLIDILKQIPQDKNIHDKILNQYLEYYQNNSNELKSIELFRTTYTSEQAIQWYINDCFLSKLLNYAFQIENFQFLYLFQFFIIDLCLQIQNEYKNISNEENFFVYHAQQMTMKDIENFKDNIGSFISINHFLLTTRHKNILLKSFEKHFLFNEYVLFQIYIDLSNKTIIFADISSYHFISNENDILFYMNSLFKIESVEYNSINSLWIIQLTTNHDGIEQINEYLKSIQKEMDYHSSLIFFGHLLWNELGQINQSENYFQILLKSLSNNHQDIPNIYIELGHINDTKYEYNLALKNYQYALTIYEKQIPKNSIHIASILNSIGNVYKHMGNIDRAIDYYRQSLDIYERKCLKNDNHLYRANTLTNLGLAYKDKNDFTTSLINLNLAYNLRYDILSNNHPLLAHSLNNIGNIYYDKNDLNQAFNYYQQALKIQEEIYPNNHLNKSHTIRNLGLIYRDKQDYQNALKYFQRTLKIREEFLLNSNHLDIAICYGDLGNIYEKLNNFDLAFDYYQKQYEIEEIYLPINHSNLFHHFDYLINLLKKQDQFDKAIELCEKKLSDIKQSFPNDYEQHPHRNRLLILLATIYEDKNPKQADYYYQQILTILESNKNDEIFSKYLSTMTNFYWKCRMFDRALICQMKLLNYRRSTLLSNHNDIAYTLRGLARLYRAMNKTNEALEYFEQSLIILQTNYGSEHIDVKNIQKEILDLKDIIKSLSLSAHEDYHHRRISNSHKQLFLMSQIDLKTSTKTNQSSNSVTKSSTCIIL